MLVQFGNNWIQKKFLGLPNWTRPMASSNLAVLGIFLIQLFPNWTNIQIAWLSLVVILLLLYSVLDRNGTKEKS